MHINSILGGIFGPAKKASAPLPAPGLQQGWSYNRMQDRIIKEVLPRLPLMDRTTGGNLRSIHESLENMGDVELPLEKVNKAEWAKLAALEDKFNQTLSEYMRLHQALAENASSRAPAGDGSGLGASSSPLAIQVRSLNTQLMAMSQQMWVQVQKLHSQDQKVGTVTQGHEATLTGRLEQLQKERAILNSLSQEQETLTGQLKDRHRRNAAAYYTYVLWLVVAIAFGMAALHRMAR
jgi:hypothetical protein